MGLELFWFPGTCARVSLIALEEAGAKVETRMLKRWDQQAVAAYLRDVNPRGRLPTLVDDGQAISETLAILTHLDRRFPEAELLPRAESDAIQALSMMSFFASGLHRAIGRLRVPFTVSDDPASFPRIQAMAADELAQGFRTLEPRLADGEWLFGRWTILDAYLLWLWFKARGSGLDGSDLPLLTAHAQRCEQRPSVRAVIEREIAAYAAVESEVPAPIAAIPGAIGWIAELP
jgi:glutathione S-transferase